MKVYSCSDCEFSTLVVEDLSDIEDIIDRVFPGEDMPDGECPDCGALVHGVETRRRAITKTRVLEGVRRVRAAALLVSAEADLLNPGDNPRHAMRMQSIVGAAIIADLQRAQDLIENAHRMLGNITKLDKGD